MTAKEYFMYITYQNDNGKICRRKQVSVIGNEIKPLIFSSPRLARESLLLTDKEGAWHQLDSQGLIWQRQLDFGSKCTLTAEICPA